MYIEYTPFDKKNRLSQLKHEHHPIADIFPMLDKQDLSDLANSIKTKGLIDAIWLYEGKILDGRNRYRACEVANVEPTFREYEGNAQAALEFAWSLNRNRRHLTPSQAAIAIEKKDRLMQTFAPVREAAKDRQSEGRSKGGQTAGRGRPKETDSSSQLIDESNNPNQNRTDAAKAKAAGTNRTYISAAGKLLDERPDLAVAVEQGKKTMTQAIREVKRDELSKNKAPPPVGKYRVIYADPPWKYGDPQTLNKKNLRSAEASNKGWESYGAADAHYPQMSISELCALPIVEIAEDNAVLFLWVTSPFLEDAFKVIKAWGFKYKTSFVWDKVKHNMGHYNSVRHEFLLIATRGSCTPDEKKLFDSVQTIERSTKHSEKPEQFREIIDTLYTNGNRIELFARRPAPGWVAWGNEAKEVAA